MALGPEYNPWYWNPNRLGAVQAPAWFLSQVQAIDTNLDVRLNPVTQHWQVWVKAPRMHYPLCQGWRLLFVHKDTGGGTGRLDETLLGRLHLIDMTNSSAKVYFDRVSAEMAREAASRDKQGLQDTLDLATERGWDHSRISVSMRGHSNGSKFAEYHS